MPTSRILRSGKIARVAEVTCRLGVHDRPYPEMHARDWTFAIVRRGHFDYRAADTNRRHRVRTNWILVGRPGKGFEVGHDCNGGDDCTSLAVPHSMMEEVASASGAMLDQPVMPPVARASAWMDRALREEFDLDEAAYFVAEALLSRSRAVPAATHADRRRLDVAIERIESDFATPLPLAELSTEAGLSPFHFLRVFRRFTGTTPHQYLLDTRLRHAARMLLDSARPVTEIAYESGFADLSNFVRTFHRTIGSSPRDFRSRR
ncbi:MAG TPA: AraC family transcriptional regulator [Myxococcales bacterium]|nr:AraC family transcriptional regulator [Myxococcales bacterium]